MTVWLSRQRTPSPRALRAGGSSVIPAVHVPGSLPSTPKPVAKYSSWPWLVQTRHLSKGQPGCLLAREGSWLRGV